MDAPFTARITDHRNDIDAVLAVDKSLGIKDRIRTRLHFSKLLPDILQRFLQPAPVPILRLLPPEVEGVLLYVKDLLKTGFNERFVFDWGIRKVEFGRHESRNGICF